MVGVFAVPQLGDARQAQAKAAGAFLFFIEEVRDGSVVFRRGDEDLDAKPLAQLQRRRAVVGLHRFHDLIIVRGVGNDRDATVVLRRTAEHGRAADVYVLDGLFERHAGLRHRGLELVEIHHHEVYRLDAVGLGLRDVLFVVAQVQEPAVDFRVQRLHAPVHHLREPGVLRNLHARDAFFSQKFGGPTGGDNLHTHSGECFRKLDQTSFIRHGNQRTFDTHS